MVYHIASRPARDVIREVFSQNTEATSLEVANIILESYDEEWFSSKTPSLSENDSVLYHACRSVKAQS